MFLPPPPELNDDSDILRKLVTSSRALASVNSNVMRLPNPYMLVNTVALQEAKTSTEIEDIFTTEDDTIKCTIKDNGEGRVKASSKVKTVV